jgi:hypothetical protein
LPGGPVRNEPNVGRAAGPAQDLPHSRFGLRVSPRTMTVQAGSVGFLGRPMGRVVDSRPRRAITSACQSGRPNGWPRRMLRPIASSSAGVIGALTRSPQSLGRVTGQASRVGASGMVEPAARWARLPHFQSSARATRPARRALRSTWRQATRKWSSSWIRNDLNRP